MTIDKAEINATAISKFLLLLKNFTIALMSDKGYSICSTFANKFCTFFTL